MKKVNEQGIPEAKWSAKRIKRFFKNISLNKFSQLFTSKKRCMTKKCKNRAIAGTEYCAKHKEHTPDNILLKQFTKTRESMAAALIKQGLILRSREEKKALERKGFLEFKRYKKYMRKCLYFVERAQKCSNHVKVAFHSAEVKRVKQILYGDLATVA